MSFAIRKSINDEMKVEERDLTVFVGAFEAFRMI